MSAHDKCGDGSCSVAAEFAVGEITGVVTGKATDDLVDAIAPMLKTQTLKNMMASKAGKSAGLPNWGKHFSDIAEGSSGRNIVGTNHNQIKPGQTDISPKFVQDKLKEIDAGEKPLIRLTSFGDEGPYITDGHHAFVAYNLRGIPLEEMQISRAHFPNVEDKKLFPNLNFQEDWSKNIFKHNKEP